MISFGHQTRNTYISRTTTDSVEIATTNSAFSTTTSSISVGKWLRQRWVTDRKLAQDCEFSAKVAIIAFPGVGHCRNCLDTVLWARRSQKPLQICRWIFDSCHSSSDISISCFGGHIAISGCRSLSQSHGHTFFELTVIENLDFAVGISILTVVVP